MKNLARKNAHAARACALRMLKSRYLIHTKAMPAVTSQIS